MFPPLPGTKMGQQRGDLSLKWQRIQEQQLKRVAMPLFVGDHSRVSHGTAAAACAQVALLPAWAGDSPVLLAIVLKILPVLLP